MSNFKDSINLTIPSKIELTLDTYYSENDLYLIGMNPINDLKINYLVFEKDDRVYFFEKPSKNLLRLFCSISRKSFYL